MPKTERLSWELPEVETQMNAKYHLLSNHDPKNLQAAALPAVLKSPPGGHG